MALSLRRQGPSKFEQAADGSMTLIEHVRELRNRLFWASLGIVAGLIVGFIVSLGVAADSFIIYFERLKDEIHEGRSARSAVPRAWHRARRERRA